MFSLVIPWRSLCPWLQSPMAAMLSLLFGGSAPRRPSTELGHDGQGGDICGGFSQETTARDFGVMVMHSVTKES